MNRKAELLAKKYADIASDFVKMFTVDGMRPGVIYYKLSEKYYLDQGTIFRIVYQQTKFQKSNKQVVDDT